MIDVGIIQGGKDMAVPVYVGKTLVYVHTDIERIENPEDPDAELYQYHEYQYPVNEYMQMMVGTQFKQSANIDYIAMMSDIDLPEEE